MSCVDRTAIDVVLQQLKDDLPAYVEDLDAAGVRHVFLSAAQHIREAASPRDLTYVNGRLNGIVRDVGLTVADGGCLLFQD